MHSFFQCQHALPPHLGTTSCWMACSIVRLTRTAKPLVQRGPKHWRIPWCAGAGGRSRACIFNLDPGQSSLQPAGELSAGSGAGSAGGNFKALRWHPVADDQLITVSESRLRRWTIRGSSIDVRAVTNSSLLQIRVLVAFTGD